MTTFGRFEEHLPELLADLGRTDSSALVRDVLATTATMRQRRRWILTRTWRSRDAEKYRLKPTFRFPPRRAFALLVIVVLGLALAAMSVVGGFLTSRFQSNLPFATPRLSATPSAVPRQPPATAFVVKTGTETLERLFSPQTVLLPDGRIAILGGGTRDVELWDPASGAFSKAGQLVEPRTDATATLLPDGRILVVGGFGDPTGDQSRLASAEIYDPATRLSHATGSMTAPRQVCHCGTTFADGTTVTASTLKDGRVLITGGTGTNSHIADLFDPASGMFTRVDIGCDAARGAQALLEDGRVLVTCLEGYNRLDGGVAGPGRNLARIFDPVTGLFKAVGSPTTTDSGSLTVLSNGRILLTGDGLARSTSRAEVFNPANETFAPIADVTNPRGPGIRLADGRVLFGANPVFAVTDAWILDPSRVTFTRVVRELPKGRIATLTADGRLLLIDGRFESIADAATALLVDPSLLP